jgi:hypothetical protein
MVRRAIGASRGLARCESLELALAQKPSTSYCRASAESWLIEDPEARVSRPWRFATRMEIDTALDPRFSTEAAKPTSWATAREELAAARTYWVTTVRPDGRPHATTVAGVWLDDRFHFATGQTERKARNLAAGNSHVLVTTGSNGWEGLDIVIEGEALPVTDETRVQRFADAMAQKYDDFFGLRVIDGHLQGGAGATDIPLPFEVRATKAFGFAKGSSFGQTRWRFDNSSA